MSEDLHFADEAPLPAGRSSAWQVLVVDDDPEVHAVTRLALQDCLVDGRALQLLSAHSAADARALLAAHKDVALILLDVVMESEHAGLEFVRHVREVAGNRRVRIVLRTGQAGQAPAREVLARYQIDDYRTKTELNFERLHVLVTSALRSYRALNELARKNLELTRSNQELERFAYVASHDLQTPLRGITSFTQILAKRYAALFDDEGREYLQFIINGGRDMQKMIADLLEVSRLGHGNVERSAVDLNQVFKRVRSALAATIASRQAEVTVDPLPTVFAREVQIEQLLRNLVDNAIKFSPQPKPWVRLSAEQVGPQWQITVADGGIGIAAEYLEKVFEVFVRLHTQDEYPGTGVGLSICRKIARLNAGELRAESTPGAGTRMIVSLPASA